MAAVVAQHELVAVQAPGGDLLERAQILPLDRVRGRRAGLLRRGDLAERELLAADLVRGAVAVTPSRAGQAPPGERGARRGLLPAGSAQAGGDLPRDARQRRPARHRVAPTGRAPVAA